MNIIKFDEFISICDEVHFELNNQTLEFVDFYLSGKIVLTEYKNLYTGMDVNLIAENNENTANIQEKEFITVFVDSLMKTIKQNKIKRMIIDKKSL